jgi:uncharacterized integral membrane protein
MLLLKRIIGITILATIAVLVFQNKDQLGTDINLSFLTISSVSLSSGIWFLLFFTAGLICWMVVDAWKSLGREGLIRKLKKDIRVLESELEAIQNKLGSLESSKKSGSIEGFDNSY